MINTSSGFQNITNVVDKNVLKIVLERNTLYVNDNICFHTTVDALNSIFGKTYKQGFHQYGNRYFISKKNNKAIWFPDLNQNMRGWTNTMPDDECVYQECLDKSTLFEISEYDLKQERAVFARKYSDEFRFVGIFHIEKYKDNFWTFKRISTELNIQEWEDSKMKWVAPHVA